MTANLVAPTPHSVTKGWWREGLFWFSVSLFVRLLVAMWAAPRFPPANDGYYYHLLALRLAEGEGYTWLWPDGVVTPAAHYPVGYPAVIGLGYWLFGASSLVPLCINSLLGALGVIAVHRWLLGQASVSVARAGACVLALHPSLLFYTAAPMTEGVVGVLMVVLAFIGSLSGFGQIVVNRQGQSRGPAKGFLLLLAFALVGAALTLMRPQSLLVVAAFAFIGAKHSNLSRRAVHTLVHVLLVLLLCLPWTLRNCAQMDRCVLFSANGGWNLLIGTSERAEGGFLPVDQVGVPEECRTVFGEAEKDACFGKAGLRRIMAAPLSWVSLVPKKLSQTFDYATPAAYYFGASDHAWINSFHQRLLGGFELVTTRLLLGVALWGLLRRVDQNKRRALIAIGWVGLVALLSPWAFVSYLSLGVLGLFAHRSARLVGSAVLLTALTHAVFFGSTRYSLVCLPLIGALSALALPLLRPTRAAAGSAAA